jgi:hypothetical protein
LIGAIRRDIAALGLVGEEDNAVLVYLLLTSRLPPNPGAIIARGSSGSGKDTLLRRVARLFPPESKIEAMAMSQAAWFNTGEDFFRHKIFIGGERRHATDDYSKDSGAMLRQLLSEGRINRGVSRYDTESKQWNTVMVERAGPVAYAETTTAASVFEEDLNRLIQIFVDDSEGQSLQVMLAMGSRNDPNRTGPDTEAVIKGHHEFQRWLQSLPTPRVHVPFWEHIAKGIPLAQSGCRRAAQQILTVIEASALLHRLKRQERNRVLIATVSDYALARRLLLGPLHAALGMGEIYKKAKKLLDAKLPVRFSTAQVHKALAMPNKMATSRFLKALLDSGLLWQMREAQGPQPAWYMWSTEDGRPPARPPDLDSLVLPSVEAIKKAAGLA